MSIMHWQGLGLAYPHKPCFSDFSAGLHAGQRVAIVGDNGSGKSSLLRLLGGLQPPSEGRIWRAPGLRIGHLPQLLMQPPDLSGGERVQRALGELLAQQPDVLLLDEPSNHLDPAQRRALLRQLAQHAGAIVIASHDIALVDQLCDTLWPIEQGRVRVFAGRHADWLAEQERQRAALTRQLQLLRRAQDAAHEALMREQLRASHARAHGAKRATERKWGVLRSPTKLGRSQTAGVDKRAALQAQQRELAAARAELAAEPPLLPRFELGASTRRHACVLQVSAGAAGHPQPVFEQLYLRLSSGERLALQGANGSGKSTLARALCGDPSITRQGDWLLPPPASIGYLDQHHADLDPALSVLDALQQRAPDWPMARLRHHLSDFLFRGNEAVQTRVAALSGGERARLALARVAARPPALLILDELCNHLDLRTRRHVAEALRAYPGAMLVISHDSDWLLQIGIAQALQLQPGQAPRLQPLLQSASPCVQSTSPHSTRSLPSCQ